LLREIPRWFPGARLNYAENLLRRNDDTIACTESNELGHLRHYSFRELHERVRSMASAFTASGLKVGDRIAGKPDPAENF
jgi:acetoacetyl-CoA synthetase